MPDLGEKSLVYSVVINNICTILSVRAEAWKNSA